jgi:hypothetical protein
MQFDGVARIRVGGTQDLDFRDRRFQAELMGLATDDHRTVHTVEVHVEDFPVDDDFVKRTTWIMETFCV